jgi:hypothetical protein
MNRRPAGGGPVRPLSTVSEQTGVNEPWARPARRSSRKRTRALADDRRHSGLNGSASSGCQTAQPNKTFYTSGTLDSGAMGTS